MHRSTGQGDQPNPGDHGTLKEFCNLNNLSLRLSKCMEFCTVCREDVIDLRATHVCQGASQQTSFALASVEDNVSVQ